MTGIVRTLRCVFDAFVAVTISVFAKAYISVRAGMKD